MNYRGVFSLTGALIALAVTGCSRTDETVKQNLTKSGFSARSAEQLSGMSLDTAEIRNLQQARNAGLDEATAADMVQSLRSHDMKFDIGPDLEQMLRQKIGPTALKQLVELGALPRWTDDIRALKDGGVGDVTIVEIARMKFEKKKEILSGNEYTRLKLRGMSDAGLLSFVQKGGTGKQLQTVAEQIALGKSEQEAMRTAGL